MMWGLSLFNQETPQTETKVYSRTRIDSFPSFTKKSSVVRSPASRMSQSRSPKASSVKQMPQKKPKNLMTLAEKLELETFQEATGENQFNEEVKGIQGDIALNESLVIPFFPTIESSLDRKPTGEVRELTQTDSANPSSPYIAVANVTSPIKTDYRRC